MINHKIQWQQMHEAWVRNKMPQAMLFVGPLHCALNDFTSELCQLLLCQGDEATEKPCKECMDCRMVSSAQHPDMAWIRPEKNGAAIKIDSIRQLQDSVYLTPQRTRHRIIIIDSANRMNRAAANALLKILEEPAAHTVFILIAEQVSTVLPTVLSRCRMIRFSSRDELGSYNLLNLASLGEPERALILNQSESILDDLIAMMESQMHPCEIATKWAAFEFSALLWFLYLVFAQLLNMKFLLRPISGRATQQLLQLSSLLDVMSIFNHVDSINSLLRQLNQHVNLNQTLAIDNLLLSMAKNQSKTDLKPPPRGQHERKGF